MSDLLKYKPYRRYSDYHDYAVVLKDNEKVLGWGTVSITKYNEDKKYSTICNVFVDEAYRGLGYGSRILDSILRFADKRGVKVKFAPHTEAGRKLNNKFPDKLEHIEENPLFSCSGTIIGDKRYLSLTFKNGDCEYICEDDPFQYVFSFDKLCEELDNIDKLAMLCA